MATISGINYPIKRKTLPKSQRDPVISGETWESEGVQFRHSNRNRYKWVEIS